MKIWAKDLKSDDDIALTTEKFTVGNDRIWDLRLARFDVLGSLAHAEMLYEVKVITKKDLWDIQKGLNAILADIEAGRFELEERVEDVHSQIELLLTRKIGDAGKKLHTGRSRNDQVLVDIKLYLKNTLKNISVQTEQIFERLLELAEQHKDHLLPGYTHLQLAMPSSFGLWFSAYAESLADDMELLVAAYRMADKNPLGSGAGYGSAFPLKRATTTRLLGFSAMNVNSVYAQMTRGKTEKAALTAIAAIASTLSRFAYDVCLYMNQQFAYVSFPFYMTTGSSIMPHKKNPDIFELIRAKCNRLQAAPNEMTLLCNNLPSGYHRDMQLTKDILFPSVDTLQECLAMLQISLDEIQVRKDILDDAKFNELYSVEEVNKLVVQGIPFREAYIMVGQSIENGTFNPQREVQHTHEGSINNLCLEQIREQMKKVLQSLQ